MKYNKETKDIQACAKEQDIIYFDAGELVAIILEDGDFNPNGISVTVWQEDKKIDLEYQKSSQDFYLPEKKVSKGLWLTFMRIVEMLNTLGMSLFNNLKVRNNNYLGFFFLF